MIEPELPYRVEYAASDRSKCQKCRKFIEIDTLRVAKIELSHLFDGLMERWFHVDCFFSIINPFSFHLITNFDNIRWDDKLLLMEKIDQTVIPPSKVGQFRFVKENGVKAIQFTRTTDDDNDDNMVFEETIKLEPFDFGKMKEQTNDFFNLRNKIQNWTSEELIEFMEEHDQFFPHQYKYEENGKQHYKLKSALVDTVTDRILFGKLNYCKSHKCNGYLVFEANVGYKCMYYSPDYKNCLKISPDVERSELIWTKDLKRRYDPVKDYVSQVKTRVTSQSIAHLKLLDHLYDEENEEIAVNTSHCGLESWTDVFQSYSKVLIRTNVVCNWNSYWRIQIRKHRREEKYWLVRSWGRIGTFRGDQTVKEMHLHECIDLFNEFIKIKENQKIRKYVPISVVDFDIIKWNDSNLDQEIKDLMKLIFNENVIIQELKKYGLDLEKIPIGMLSLEQVLEAKKALEKVEGHIRSPSWRFNLIRACDKFYSLIPHVFGNKRPPVLDNTEDLLRERNLLTQLMTMTALEFPSGLDILFNKLKMKIEVLNRETSDFEAIELYVKNSHSPCHNTFKIEIDQVFIIKKNQEKKLKLENEKFLWHGTKLQNVAGILANGFKISAAEADKTGCTFGKGIYFTDVASKAANFSGAKEQYPVGILLLCKVALGEVKKFSEVSFVNDLPEGCDSIAVEGIYQPQYQSNYSIDGIKIPSEKCKPVFLATGSGCNHNEYVVFNPDQVDVRYIVQVKFNHSPIEKTDKDSPIKV